MLTFRELRHIQPPGPTVVTIGNFDGLHRGHHALLAVLRQSADAWATRNGVPARTALVTFDPHPLAVLRPELANLLLTTPRERLLLAAQAGVDLGVVQPFTREFAQLTPHDFVNLLVTHLGMVTLVVGPDFALGRNRAGDITTLAALGQTLGFTVQVLEPVAFDGQLVRSSRVRELVQTGDVAQAASLLGRPYRLTGAVERGDQRGRTVGIPTANVHAPVDKLLPADGVYASWTILARFDGVQRLPSVTNVGVRPTVDGLHRRVEAHILDFPPSNQIDDLYGEIVAIEFLQRLRGEQRFANIDALVGQIQRDIAQARAWFVAERKRF